MANYSISSLGVLASSSYHTRTSLIGLRVYERKYMHDSVCIDVWTSDTLQQLKEKIATYLCIGLPLNKFFLEIYDGTFGQWNTINDANSSKTIYELNIRSGSLINVEYYAHQVPKSAHHSYTTSISNINNELKLKLCLKPKDRTDYDYLYINSASTLGKLRKQVYAQLNKVAKDQPIFVWNRDDWMKFDYELDEHVLEDLSIESYTFISIDYDEEYGKSPAGLCGLSNLGSTCFMNSVWQCLSNIPEFKDNILAFNNEVNAPIIGEYIKLMKQMWSGRYSIIEPSLLVDNINDHLPHYSTYRQQDAQEFMNHFLHLIHAELSTKETLITELFYGQIRSTVKCLTCQRTESTNESISFLPLPISSYNQKNILYTKSDGEQRVISISTDASVITVGDLIDCFIRQHEPTLNKERILVFRLVNNVAKEQYETYRSLIIIDDKELVFIECQEKLAHQRYIWCDFFDHSTSEMFRPSTLLVCPVGKCYYAHLSEQLDQILGHLCSMTGASVSDCYLSWKNDLKQVSELDVKQDENLVLSRLNSIMIEMPSKYVDIYKACYDINHLSDNSGLRGLLGDFFREESLVGDYHCLKCSKLTKARQKSDLCLPLPRVLIIQLKRFTYDAYSNNKIDTFISFPLDGLDLREYIVKDDSNKNASNLSTKYELVAVSNHTGSLSSGHYTAYAKNAQNGKWYLFDDKYIRKLDNADDVVTKNAYILVYIQKTNDK